MKQNDMTKPFDVIVIGGGATGAGIARDCARRGIRVLLIERFDISTGATGRNHGLLHSGARYAVTDQESAEEQDSSADCQSLCGRDRRSVPEFAGG